jgi:hypothetical protein
MYKALSFINPMSYFSPLSADVEVPKESDVLDVPLLPEVQKINNEKSYNIDSDEFEVIPNGFIPESLPLPSDFSQESLPESLPLPSDFSPESLPESLPLPSDFSPESTINVQKAINLSENSSKRGSISTPEETNNSQFTSDKDISVSENSITDSVRINHISANDTIPEDEEDSISVEAKNDDLILEEDEDVKAPPQTKLPYPEVHSSKSASTNSLNTKKSHCLNDKNIKTYNREKLKRVRKGVIERLSNAITEPETLAIVGLFAIVLNVGFHKFVETK